MSKKELRANIKTGLQTLSREDREKQGREIQANLFQFPYWRNAETIGITISFGHEIDTYNIIRKAWHDGKKVVVPRCIRETKQLQFYLLTNFSQLEDSFYGLKEPDPAQTKPIDGLAIDFLIVPGLLFDRRGYRVGYGGGYYDRFLAKYHPFTCALAYSIQLTDDQLPNEPFDIPVKSIITNKEVILV